MKGAAERMRLYGEVLASHEEPSANELPYAADALLAARCIEACERIASGDPEHPAVIARAALKGADDE